MRFLRGALYNYFPIAGTETLLNFCYFECFVFTIISPLRGLKHNNLCWRETSRHFTIISSLRGLKLGNLIILGKHKALYNYFPIAGTETSTTKLLMNVRNLYNYFPIAGAETYQCHHFCELVQTLELSPHYGDNKLI